MKLILSRKGFDSGSGGLPNLILPDGSLLSMPIPEEFGTTTYQDVQYNGKSYYDFLQELKPGKFDKMSKCHVDPDLSYRYRAEIVSKEIWKPAFGQQGSSLIHLDNNSVDIGDIFLFFGWFRQTENSAGKLRFVRNQKNQTLDKHVIYGYMQVGEIIRNQEDIRERFPYHPHAMEEYAGANALYLPSDVLTFNPHKRGMVY